MAHWRSFSEGVIFMSMDFTLSENNCHAERPIFSSPKVYEKVRAMVENYPKNDEEVMRRHFLGHLYQSYLPPALLLKKVSPEIGMGLFADQVIKKEAVVGEYTGLVKKKPFITPRRKDYVGEYTIPGYPVKYVIDAETHGSLMRFINHSEEGNVSSITVIIDGLLRIFVIAEKTIEPGKQLLMDYGPAYWKGRKAPKKI